MKKRELLLLFLIIVLDLGSKQYFAQNFVLGQSLVIIPHFFHLTYLHNTGAAWGMFPQLTSLFYVVSLIGSVVFIFWLIKIPAQKKYYRLMITLMLAGTLGNLYDRLILHYVRDFLDFYIFGYDFPVFNVADSALTLGVIGLFLLAWLKPTELTDE